MISRQYDRTIYILQNFKQFPIPIRLLASSNHDRCKQDLFIVNENYRNQKNI
jgi:hypothetical protein